MVMGELALPLAEHRDDLHRGAAGTGQSTRDTEHARRSSGRPNRGAAPGSPPALAIRSRGVGRRRSPRRARVPGPSAPSRRGSRASSPVRRPGRAPCRAPHAPHRPAGGSRTRRRGWTHEERAKTSTPRAPTRGRPCETAHLRASIAWSEPSTPTTTRFLVDSPLSFVRPGAKGIPRKCSPAGLFVFRVKGPYPGRRRPGCENQGNGSSHDDPPRAWIGVMLVLVEVLAVTFGLVNGVHDAGNAIAAPVVTRALRPGPAVTLAACSTSSGR